MTRESELPYPSDLQEGAAVATCGSGADPATRARGRERLGAGSLEAWSARRDTSAADTLSVRDHHTTVTRPALAPRHALGPRHALVPVYALAPVCAPVARALALPRTLADAGGPQATGVAVTFDDGPHPDGTPMMLEALAAHGAVATFFVIGEQVERRPELLRRIVAEGHGLALHGYRHRLQPRVPERDVRDDLRRGLAAIEDAAGVTPGLHRPPYGVYSPSGLRVTRELGLKPLLWARWGKDWRRLTTPARIARRVVDGLAPGDVILLHDADFYSSQRSHETNRPRAADHPRRAAFPGNRYRPSCLTRFARRTTGRPSRALREDGRVLPASRPRLDPRLQDEH